MPTEHHASVHRDWHRLAAAGDVDGLIALYAEDAQFESPLVRALDPDADSGVIRGTTPLRRFLEEAMRRRPNSVRGYRSGRWLADGPLLIWEYPRESPEGDQLDLVEVMELDHGRISRHRVYWGWVGFDLLADRST